LTDLALAANGRGFSLRSRAPHMPDERRPTPALGWRVFLGENNDTAVIEIVGASGTSWSFEFDREHLSGFADQLQDAKRNLADSAQKIDQSDTCLASRANTKSIPSGAGRGWETSAFLLVC
jgi:hypothetical protein